MSYFLFITAAMLGPIFIPFPLKKRELPTIDHTFDEAKQDPSLKRDYPKLDPLPYVLSISISICHRSECYHYLL